MTIKKPMKAASAATADTMSLPTGGATIADRFKLDAPPVAPKAASGKITLFALLAALVALGVAGMLTFTLWKHWEFLQGA